MKKQVIKLASFVLISAFFTGCWNRRELTDMAFVFARGFDINEEGKYSSTAQVLDTGKGSEGENGGNRGLGYYVVTSEGRSIFSTSRNAARESGRRLYAGQNKVIVIGEELAKSGILPIVDHWYRDIESVPLANIFIAKGLASDIIKANHPAEDIPGLAINQLIEVSYASSRVGTINLYNLMKTITSKTSGSYASGIETVENQDTNQSVRLNNTAIFKKDKLIGWFNDDESRGLLWILGKVKTGDIEVLSPTTTEKNPQIVPLKILKQTQKKLEPKIEDGKLSIKIKVKTDCMVGTAPDFNINLDKVSTIKELEARAEKQIKNDIQAAIDKGQKEFKVNVFQFDEAFHKKYPKQWKELEKNWDIVFEDIQVTKEVEVRILRVGLVTSYDKEEAD